MTTDTVIKIPKGFVCLSGCQLLLTPHVSVSSCRAAVSAVSSLSWRWGSPSSWGVVAERGPRSARWASAVCGLRGGRSAAVTVRSVRTRPSTGRAPRPLPPRPPAGRPSASRPAGCRRARRRAAAAPGAAARHRGAPTRRRQTAAGRGSRRATAAARRRRSLATGGVPRTRWPSTRGRGRSVAPRTPAACARRRRGHGARRAPSASAPTGWRRTASPRPPAAGPRSCRGPCNRRHAEPCWPSPPPAARSAAVAPPGGCIWRAARAGWRPCCTWRPSAACGRAGSRYAACRMCRPSEDITQRRMHCRLITVSWRYNNLDYWSDVECSQLTQLIMPFLCQRQHFMAAINYDRRRPINFAPFLLIVTKKSTVLVLNPGPPNFRSIRSGSNPKLALTNHTLTLN